MGEADLGLSPPPLLQQLKQPSPHLFGGGYYVGRVQQARFPRNHRYNIDPWLDRGCNNLVHVRMMMPGSCVLHMAYGSSTKALENSVLQYSVPVPAGWTGSVRVQACQKR